MANTYTWDFPTLDTAPSEDGFTNSLIASVEESDKDEVAIAN